MGVSYKVVIMVRRYHDATLTQGSFLEKLTPQLRPHGGLSWNFSSKRNEGGWRNCMHKDLERTSGVEAKTEGCSIWIENSVRGHDEFRDRENWGCESRIIKSLDKLCRMAWTLSWELWDPTEVTQCYGDRGEQSSLRRFHKSFAGSRRMNRSSSGEWGWKGIAEEPTYGKAWKNEGRGWRILQSQHGWGNVWIMGEEAGKLDKLNYENLVYYVKELLFYSIGTERWGCSSIFRTFSCDLLHHFLCQA